MISRWKNAVKVSIVAVSVTALVAGCTSTGKGKPQPARHSHSGKIKNVIVMIPDGCDETVQTVARWIKGEDLQVDKMVGGSVKTHMANSVITGSAAAATAFATGHKTTVRFLGVGPRTDDLLTGVIPTADPYEPVASILEAAKLNGKATGIVATSRVTHATPAAFACHIQDRGWDNDIMEHLVYNNIDVVFGGGALHLFPAGEENAYTTTFGATWKGKRTDGENLMQVLRDRGYQFVDNKADMFALTSAKVWGLFDDSHMQPDMDRRYFADHEPSLSEMTAKAIELLSGDKDGFFLVVEGSQIDWAGHNNDPIYMVKDFIAFDDAVKVACDFAADDGHTLVLAYPDHNTGGMKIGHYNTAVEYTKTTVEDLVDPLKGMSITSQGLVGMLENDTDQELVAKVAEFWSLDITRGDVTEIRDLETSVGLAYALARVLSRNYTVIGWTTHGHNGETVPLWVYGADIPKGILDNTKLAAIAADVMGVDLAKATSDLYVDVSTVTSDFEIVGDQSIGNYGFDNNLVLKIADAELPISKDYMVRDGQTIQLPGVTVYAPETGKVYVSNAALEMLHLK